MNQPILLERVINRALFYDYGVEFFVWYKNKKIGLCKCFIFDDNSGYVYKNDEVYHVMLDLDVGNLMSDFNKIGLLSMTAISQLDFWKLAFMGQPTFPYDYFRLHITPISQTMISCELNDGTIKEISYELFSKFAKYKPYIKLNISNNEFITIENYYQIFVFVLMATCCKNNVTFIFNLEKSHIFKNLFDSLEIKYDVEFKPPNQVIYNISYTENVITIFFSNFPDSSPLYIDELTFYNTCKNAHNILQKDKVYVNIDAPTNCDLVTLFNAKVGMIENYRKCGVTDSFCVQSYEKIMKICEFFGINAS